MKTIAELLEEKRRRVLLVRDDLVMEMDDPDWRKNHPLGPVHVQVVCRLCGEVLARDLREYGWLENDSFWGKNIAPHFERLHC
jgi:hypothetical protein